jgi:hypothetical protein
VNQVAEHVAALALCDGHEDELEVKNEWFITPLALARTVIEGLEKAGWVLVDPRVRTEEGEGP